MVRLLLLMALFWVGCGDSNKTPSSQPVLDISLRTRSGLWAIGRLEWKEDGYKWTYEDSIDVVMKWRFNSERKSQNGAVVVVGGYSFSFKNTIDEEVKIVIEKLAWFDRSDLMVAEYEINPKHDIVVEPFGAHRLNGVFEITVGDVSVANESDLSHFVSLVQVWN